MIPFIRRKGILGRIVTRYLNYRGCVSQLFLHFLTKRGELFTWEIKRCSGYKEGSQQVARFGIESMHGRWDAKHKPRDYGSARNFGSGLRDWRTFFADPLQGWAAFPGHPYLMAAQPGHISILTGQTEHAWVLLARAKGSPFVSYKRSLKVARLGRWPCFPGQLFFKWTGSYN